MSFIRNFPDPTGRLTTPNQKCAYFRTGFAQGVFDQERATQIAKTPGQRSRTPQTFIDLTKQEHAAIAADVSCREVGDYLTRTQGIEEQGLKVGGKLGRSG